MRQIKKLNVKLKLHTIKVLYKGKLEIFEVQLHIVYIFTYIYE